jgi:hypothetical protein
MRTVAFVVDTRQLRRAHRSPRKTLEAMVTRGSPSYERFVQMVLCHDTDACLIWGRAKHKDDYGFVRTPSGRSELAHRVAWRIAQGHEIPEGMVLDHLCRNTRCVNPTHLEPVTSRENTLRGNSPNVRTRQKQECKRGHPYTGDNIRLALEGKRGVRRMCRKCFLAAHARYDRKRDRRKTKPTQTGSDAAS